MDPGQIFFFLNFHSICILYSRVGFDQLELPWKNFISEESNSVESESSSDHHHHLHHYFELVKKTFIFLIIIPIYTFFRMQFPNVIHVGNYFPSWFDWQKYLAWSIFEQKKTKMHKHKTVWKKSAWMICWSFLMCYTKADLSKTASNKTEPNRTRHQLLNTQRRNKIL